MTIIKKNKKGLNISYLVYIELVKDGYPKQQNCNPVIVEFRRYVQKIRGSDEITAFAKAS